MNIVLSTIVRGLGAKRAGSSWMARCPVHDDQKPSLAIRESQDRVLLHCHAGCDQREVIDALKALDLWQPASQDSERRIAATYDYSDERGHLLYQVVRYEPKDFRQRRPDGRGGWIWEKGERQVLYRLREVMQAPIIFLVEGEKDAETLRSYGFVATTNAGGAKAAWLPQYTEALSGREVFLIPDADAPGRQRVVTIARALLGKAARIIVWEPEDAKDITAWFANGHSELDLIRQVEGEAVRQ